ncbi:hypothetical protein PM082_009921 [Marasmius tenuissimus]|nr:hypothetical protein PM082_009921 [Marasmius tenuissimus]
MVVLDGRLSEHGYEKSHPSVLHDIAGLDYRSLQGYTDCSFIAAVPRQALLENLLSCTITQPLGCRRSGTYSCGGFCEGREVEHCYRGQMSTTYVAYGSEILRLLCHSACFSPFTFPLFFIKLNQESGFITGLHPPSQTAVIFHRLVVNVLAVDSMNLAHLALVKDYQAGHSHQPIHVSLHGSNSLAVDAVEIMALSAHVSTLKPCRHVSTLLLRTYASGTSSKTARFAGLT